MKLKRSKYTMPDGRLRYTVLTTGGVVLQTGRDIPSGVVVVTDIDHRPVLFIAEEFEHFSDHTVHCFLRINPHLTLEEHDPVDDTDDMTHDLLGSRTDPTLN